MNILLVSLRKLYYKLLFKLPFHHSEWTSYTPLQKGLFNSLAVGDIVDAWMPLDEKQLIRIPEDHRHRPWYIVEKHDTYLTAYLGSSSIEHRDPYRCVLIKEKNHNKMWKDGYAVITKTWDIPIDCLIEKLGHLYVREIEKINRVVSISNNHSKYEKLPALGKRLLIKDNDIVISKGKYFWVHTVKPEIRTTPLDYERQNHNAFIHAGKYLFWFSSWETKNLERKDIESVFFEFSTPPKVHMDWEYGKEKHDQKKKHAVSERHTFRYPAGQIFLDAQSGRQMIYLYSWHGKDFGISSNTSKSSIHRVMAVNFSSMQKLGLASDEMMTMILNELIAYDRRKYGWLNSLMTQ